MQDSREHRCTGRRRLVAGALLVVSCGAVTSLVSCGRATRLPDLAPAAAEDPDALLARGEYIVRSVAVCGHCHAAEPQSDPDGPLVGGLEFRDWRLGTIRAPNLTPDSATGIGSWTEREIVRALRTGEGWDGDLLTPVMPYAWFHGMSDRDALAVVRYLLDQPAVRHEVEGGPNLIFEMARTLFLRPLDPPDSATVPIEAPSPSYGRYLAHHVALCADCHTPRTGIRDRPDLGRLFAGQSDPPSGFPANPANLTPDTATGIGRWTEADFMRALRRGVDPRGDSLHAFMPWRQFRRMSDDDLRAIYRYLRTLTPVRNEIPHRDHEHGAPHDLADHPKVISLFDRVREIPQIVDGIRCYCGCDERPESYSLLSCYEDGMAKHCLVCQGEARLASRMHADGKSLDEIRAAIDVEFGY